MNIRHMFDVIDDKTEDVARWVIVYKHKPVGLEFIRWPGLCVINPRAGLQEGFIRQINPLMFDMIDDINPRA